LHVVTQSAVAEEPGVHVHRGVAAYGPVWWDRWRSADVFVFPSTLETFGIVLLEALAFRVPVVSSRAGAAAEVLDGGAAGVLLDEVTPGTIASAVRGVFADPGATAARVDRGAARAAERYALAANARRLAAVVRAGANGSPHLR
jgi:glycosyltransferase involved in cell wall biosynthesis